MNKIADMSFVILTPAVLKFTFFGRFSAFKSCVAAHINWHLAWQQYLSNSSGIVTSRSLLVLDSHKCQQQSYNHSKHSNILENLQYLEKFKKKIRSFPNLFSDYPEYHCSCSFLLLCR